MLHKVLLLTLILFASNGCVSHNFPLIRPNVKKGQSIAEKEKAQEYFIQARDFERRGIKDMAEHYYELAYNLDPASETLREEIARKYIESDKYSKALALVKGSKSNQALSVNEKRLVSTIYIKMGEFEKAAEVLETIPIKTDEEIYSLGLIYESLNNTVKAIKSYTDYFKKNPKSLEMGYKIGKLLIGAKRFTEAESVYNGLLEKLKENPDIYLMLGNLRIIQGDSINGLDFFSKALNIDSTHEGALRSSAQIYILRNDYVNAIKNYEKLYKYNDFGDVYGRTLSILYFYNKQYDSAEQILNELLQNSIDDYELHYYLGLVFEAEMRYDLAKIEFEKTLTIRNTFDDAWKEICYLLVRQKEFDEALETADRCVKLLPDQSSSWKIKGYVHNARKEYANSISAFSRSILLDSTDVYVWFELGCAYERNQNYEQSYASFKKVLKIHPDDPATLNYLGFMWAEKSKNLDSAKMMIEKALKIDPDNGAYIDSYAWVFYQMGNVDSAYKYMEIAVKKINNDPVVYTHLGDVLYKKKNYKQALDAYQKSLDLNAEDPDIIRKKILELKKNVNENGLIRQ